MKRGIGGGDSTCATIEQELVLQFHHSCGADITALGKEAEAEDCKHARALSSYMQQTQEPLRLQPCIRTHRDP